LEKSTIKFNRFRHNDNIWIRRLYFRYLHLRNLLHALISSPIVFVLRCLPTRISALIKSKLELHTRMPYILDLYVDVDADRDLRRAGFPVREPETIEWIEDCAKQGGVLYDVGANIGAVALIYAANLSINSNANGCAFAFEPLPFTFERLCKNIFLNKLDKMVFPFQVPLSDHKGTDILFANTIEAGSSGHTLASENNEYEKSFSLPVIAMTIDDLHDDLKFPSPDWLKIDVDGHDYKVLLGARKLIKAGFIKSILIEKNNYEFEIKRFLEREGFFEVPFLRSGSDINLRFDRRQGE